MSPAEYKKQVKNLFASLAVGDSESYKIAKIDAFLRKKGARKNLRHF